METAFYRVTSRAVIRDEHNRVLVLKRKKDHTYELPGGGWEYDESFQDCLRREVSEELGVELTDMGSIWFTYRGKSEKWDSHALRLVVSAKLSSYDFTLGETIAQAHFVDKPTFAALEWVDVDREVADYIDVLWPPVEKKHKN